MDDLLSTAWIVSGVGLLVLFLALLLLYLLMTAMTALARERPPAQAPVDDAEEELAHRAAAIAVALALAEQEQERAGTPEGPQPPSPWRALHHQRRLDQRRRAGGAR